MFVYITTALITHLRCLSGINLFVKIWVANTGDWHRDFVSAVK